MNPCALTPETRESLLLHLRLGNYIHTACRAAGITSQTYYYWMRRGRQGEEPYASFAKEAKEALALAEIRDLATIQRASAEQWQAAAWRLERRYPKRWGRRPDASNIVINTKRPGPSLLDLPARMPPAAVRSIVSAMLEHEASEPRRQELTQMLNALEGLEE